MEFQDLKGLVGGWLIGWLIGRIILLEEKGSFVTWTLQEIGLILKTCVAYGADHISNFILLFKSYPISYNSF